MNYNESIAPRYSRNPLTLKSANLQLSAASKNHTSSFNQLLQFTKTAKIDAAQSRDSINQIFQTSISKKSDVLNKSFNKNKDANLTTKERKIQQLRSEINNDESSDAPHANRDIRNSKASRASTLKTTNFVTEKVEGDHSFSSQPFQESMFSPKILNKSKSMMRKANVSTLLFADAKRRQQKQQWVLQSDRKQRQLLMSPKINPNTNALVLKKIQSQFKDLVTEEEMSPLIALSVLEQIFNVNLNPHKQTHCSASVQRLITLLTSGTNYGQIKIEKLWQFVVLIIMSSLENSLFSKEQEREILQNYQYFYKQRVARQKKSISPDKPTFRPKTLESSSKLASSFREKACQKIDTFIQQEKVALNIKDGHYTIEDLFIIQHHKNLSQNQRKKIEKQNQELQLCTFKPDLSPSSSSLNIIKQKPKIPLRSTKAEHLKTQHISNNYQNSLAQSQTEVSSIKPKKKAERGRRTQAGDGRQPTLADNIRDVEKVILRMSVGRQKREFSSKVVERGYPKDENWTQMQKSMHKQNIENYQRLKGFKSK